MNTALRLFLTSLLTIGFMLIVFTVLTLQSHTYPFVMATLKGIPIQWEVNQVTVPPENSTQIQGLIETQKHWDTMNAQK